MEHLVFEQNHQLDCFAGAIHLSGHPVQLAVVVECLFIDCCHDCLVQETQFQPIGFGVGWRDCLSSSVFSNPLDYPKSKGIGHFQFEKKHFDCRTQWTRHHFAMPNDSLLETASKNQVFNSYSMGNFSSLKSKKRLRNLMYFNGNKILVVDSSGVYPKGIRPDIVVLTQSPKINFERFLQDIQPKMVVADASNFRTIQKLWKATCLKRKSLFTPLPKRDFIDWNKDYLFFRIPLATFNQAVGPPAT